MFNKILIANRGEIAVRILRACRDLNIRPVTVFSEADRESLHVRLADEAVCIGPPPSTESYLRVDRIIDAARHSGANAIHPGYGFLAENAGFAQAVQEAGFVFIGPTWQAIDALGDKTRARTIALSASAPVVPGLTKPVTRVEELRAQAEDVGYPILLKAAAGGGGKGMRLVASQDELEAAFSLARSEAESAFGNGAIYFEKYIERPRHIEIQILADQQGHVIHCGERECSVQRRHQKVIEECPSPLNDPVLRQRMGEVAVRIAGEAGYINAGTVEFLVDQDRNFYFLEVNTRLQVEHPVTEMVTGVDLVREQIRIAAGLPLSLSQSDIEWRGSAIECRIYAENADLDFMPSPGRIRRLRPPSGPGIRDDSGVYGGWVVPIDYDPLLAKLVAWGRDRSEAIDRMRRALDEYVLDGIDTTIPFYSQVFRDPEFIEGHLDTGYIPRFMKRKGQPRASVPTPARQAAMIAGVLQYENRATGVEVSNNGRPTASAWKQQGRKMQMESRL